MASKNLPPRPETGANPAQRTAPARPTAPAGNPSARPVMMPQRVPTGPAMRGPVASDPRTAGAQAAAAAPEEDEAPAGGWMDEVKGWLGASGGSYLASMLFHTALFLLLALILGVRYVVQQINSAPTFDAPEVAEVETSEFKPFDLTVPADVEPSEIDLEHTLQQGNEKSTKLDGPPMDQDAKFYDNSDKFEDAGGGMKVADASAPQLGGGGLDFASVRSGPAAKGLGGLGSGVGTGENPGSGGSGSGFGGRGSGHREAMVGRYGGTKATERSVAAALNWFARHQSRDGSWSLQKYVDQCHGAKCDGAGGTNADAAGTAFGLLPFLAAGQTHTAKGMYQQTIRRGLIWLMAHQNKTNGDLSAGPTLMYTHGLATIALCEAYGLTKDSQIRYAAQAAVKFIEASQDQKGGGWRYHPGEAGDTSVVGWQVMALKSAHMAGLDVNPQVLNNAKNYIASAAGSDYGGMFGYTPGAQKTTAMTAVGLLCKQYQGAPRADPGLAEGTRFLMANLPDETRDRNTYYWYYATQVMHNMLGDDWDKWNRKMRRILVDTQNRQGCATGSWDPAKPINDAWGPQGGRVMLTSLSCLTLEIYYRYLPLYDLEKKGAGKGLEVDAKGAAPKLDADK
ncbi:MAG: hypothetical protein K8T25_22795 [Planctomycetia bacterium]|nr:hypothetical protein [Planctomycetia bacterium]